MDEAKPRAKVTKARGRRRENFARPQIVEFVRLFREENGRAMWRGLTGVSYRRFLRQFREEERFVEDVRITEAVRVESCERLLLKLVTGTLDTPIKLLAAIAYLGRRDKREEALRARRDKARAAASKSSARRKMGNRRGKFVTVRMARGASTIRRVGLRRVRPGAR